MSTDRLKATDLYPQMYQVLLGFMEEKGIKSSDKMNEIIEQEGPVEVYFHLEEICSGLESRLRSKKFSDAVIRKKLGRLDFVALLEEKKDVTG